MVLFTPRISPPEIVFHQSMPRFDWSALLTAFFSTEQQTSDPHMKDFRISYFTDSAGPWMQKAESFTLVTVTLVPASRIQHESCCDWFILWKFFLTGRFEPLGVLWERERLFLEKRRRATANSCIRRDGGAARLDVAVGLWKRTPSIYEALLEDSAIEKHKDKSPDGVQTPLVAPMHHERGGNAAQMVHRGRNTAAPTARTF